MTTVSPVKVSVHFEKTVNVNTIVFWMLLGWRALSKVLYSCQLPATLCRTCSITGKMWRGRRYCNSWACQVHQETLYSIHQTLGQCKHQHVMVKPIHWALLFGFLSQALSKYKYQYVCVLLNALRYIVKGSPSLQTGYAKLSSFGLPSKISICAALLSLII